MDMDLNGYRQDFVHNQNGQNWTGHNGHGLSILTLLFIPHLTYIFKTNTPIVLPIMFYLFIYFILSSQ